VVPEELGEKGAGAEDGSGDQLGKERHVDGEVEEVIGRDSPFPVDVDGVAEGLEGVERDSERQHEAEHELGIVEGR